MRRARRLSPWRRVMVMVVMMVMVMLLRLGEGAQPKKSKKGGKGKKASSSKTHIFLATPSYGGTVVEGYALGLVDLSIRIYDMAPDVRLSIKMLSGDSLVTRARNTLVAHFLSCKDCTHLLFIDSDITYRADDVLRLLEMSKMKAIVAAPYPKKGFDFHHLRNHINRTLTKDPKHEFTDTELQESMMNYVYNSFVEGHDHPTGEVLQVEDGFMPTDSVGTGFLMIRREVIEEMVLKYKELKYRNDVALPGVDPGHFVGLFDTMIDPRTGRYLSEDYAFCRRARTLGYSMYLDVTADLQHQGIYNFDGNFMREFDVMDEE